jgi:hypothetical protein
MSELTNAIIRFRNYPEAVFLDDLTIGAIILNTISESQGAEDFNSINDTHVRDGIRAQMEQKKNEIIRYLNQYGLELLEDYCEGRCPEDQVIPLFSINRFIRAINQLRQGGRLDLYLTNWRKYGDEIWSTYLMTP